MYSIILFELSIAKLNFIYNAIYDAYLWPYWIEIFTNAMNQTSKSEKMKQSWKNGKSGITCY